MKQTRVLYRAAALLALACASLASAATVNVSSLSGLQSAINAAAAGDTIVMANGTYSGSSPISITKAATSAAHVTIKAASVGGVTIGGSAAFQFASPAAYIDVSGFVFTHSNSISIPHGTNHIRISRCVIQLSIPAGSDVSYINISGDDVQIDYNELRNKSTLGEMLDISGSGSQVALRLWVHHNYFHDFTSPGGNGAETIRWGLSGLSLSTGSGICEYNLFVRCEGENEMISNKSSGNTYRYNTVLDCVGGEISQRHGDNCQYYGNYMKNTQGMRIYGDSHLIHSNYLEGNTSGINMGNGDGDVHNGDPLTSHDRPDNNIVVFNTLINNDTQYQMGGRTGGLGATNTTFANNIIQGGTTAVSISSSAPYTNPVWSGNIIWNAGSIGNIPSSGYSNVDPLLAADASGVLHIQSGSPAIGTATGTYSGVTVDMDGQPRPSTGKDKGADETSTAAVTAWLLTTADVGPNAGGTVATPTFSPAPGTYTSAQSVTISTSTSGASIRYTTDGSTPTSTTGTLYSGAISIGATTTLKAIAFKSGMTNSSVASGTYTINIVSGGTTITSADGFFNRTLGSSQSGSFSVDFDASVSISPSNTTFALCQGSQAAYTGLACMIRFNTTGFVDARNGGAFAAVTSFAFNPNTTYHIHMDVNVASHTYSATITPPSSSAITIASNYAFRTEQAGVTAIDTFNVDVNATPGGSATFGATTVTASASPVKFSIPGTSVTDSSNDGNVAANAVDGSLATRWSSSGDGQWIRFDIGSTKTVKLVKVAFYSGDTRTSTLDVQTSSDGTTFTTIKSFTSSGTSLSLETIDVPDTSARYVRLLGHGNSVNLWNSYTEVEVWGN